MQVDDPAIPDSFRIAGERGMDFSLEGIDLGDVHPNSVKMNLTGVSGRTLEVVAASIGGGRIQICELDRDHCQFQRRLSDTDRAQHRPAGTCHRSDFHARTQGCQHSTMQLYRKSRGGSAVMVIECDQEVPKESLAWLAVRGHIKSDILQSCGRVEFIIRK